MKRRIIDILLVTLGSFIAAVGYNSLLVKNNIASGGVGGLAISLNALFGWNNANFVLATTIPLLILCWFFLGREVLLKTFYGSLVFPTFIKLTEGLPTLTKQPLLAAIFGGIVLGLGLGIVFYGNWNYHTNSQQIYATPTRNGTTYCRWDHCRNQCYCLSS